MVYQIHPSYAKTAFDQNVLRQIASGSVGGIPLTYEDHLTEFMRMAIVDALMDANGEIISGDKYCYINPRKDPSHEKEGEIADNLIWRSLWSMDDTSAFRDEERCLSKPKNPRHINLNLRKFMEETRIDFTRNWFGTSSVTASIFMIKESDIRDYGWEIPKEDMMFDGDETLYQNFIDEILARARRLARDLHFMQSLETTKTILTASRVNAIMHCLSTQASFYDYGDLVSIYREMSLSMKNFEQLFHKIYHLSWPCETIHKFIQMIETIASREYCIRSEGGILYLPNRGMVLACDEQLEILEKGRGCENDSKRG